MGDWSVLIFLVCPTLVQGLIQLDEVQQDYLFALLGTSAADAHQQAGQSTSAALSNGQARQSPGLPEFIMFFYSVFSMTSCSTIRLMTVLSFQNLGLTSSPCPLI